MKGEILYRLVVTYPEDALDEWGGLKEDWAPEGWKGFPRGHSMRDGDDSFIWPANKLYWSPSGALARAALFESYGAAVDVLRSEPIRWEPEPLKRKRPKAEGFMPEPELAHEPNGETF